eukprot:gene3486-3984_t
MACLPYYKGIQYPTNVVFFLINALCAIMSVFGNSLTIFAIYRKHHLQSPSNWLLAGLSFTDLLAGAIAQPMYSIYLSFFADQNNCVLEKSVVFMSATSCSTSLLHLCMIARDRFLHISKGVRYSEYTNKRQVFGLVVGCWMAGLIIASTFMLSSPAWTQFLGFATFSSVQFFSFIYIAITYFRIKHIISAHFKNQRSLNNEVAGGANTQHETTSTGQSRARIAQERSHNLTLLMLLILFVIVWFPFMVVLIVGTVYQAAKKKPGPWLQDGFVWTAILTYVNGAINPLIYAIRYRELGLVIRRYCRKLFFCCCRDNAIIGVNDDQTATTTTTTGGNQSVRFNATT